jgi:hypothetical protein
MSSRGSNWRSSRETDLLSRIICSKDCGRIRVIRYLSNGGEDKHSGTTEW